MKILKLVVTLCLLGLFSCKDEPKIELAQELQEEDIIHPDYFDFSNGADTLSLVKFKQNPERYNLTLVGKFLATRMTHRELKLKNTDAAGAVIFNKENLENTFKPGAFYAVENALGITSVFKFSSVKLSGNNIQFINNLKWFTYPPRNTLKDIPVKVWRFNFNLEDSGKVRICTISDSQLHFQDAQDFRRTLDAAYQGQLKFLGKSKDNNDYAFHAYSHYTVYDLKKSRDFIPKSDYYLINIGTNEWKKPPSEVIEKLFVEIAYLSGHNPNSQILLSTIMPVGKELDNAKIRDEFVNSFNQLLRDQVKRQNLKNVILLDIAGSFSNPKNPQLFRPDGVHLSTSYYRHYLELINKELIKNPTLASYYTGVLEHFNTFPLSDQLLYSSPSSTTQAGNYKLERVAGQTALRSELSPTVALKAPHRSEFHLELDPFYSQDQELWAGFKFLVPQDWVLDSVNLGKRLMIFQIHSKPEPGQTWKFYQQNLPFNRPSIALYLVTKKEGIWADLYYGLNGKPDFEYSNKKWSKIGSQQIKKDTWLDFKVNFKLGDDDSGFIRAWLNHESFIAKTNSRNTYYGANMHNNALPYMKFGQYRYWKDSHAQVVYYDDLKVHPSAAQFFFPNPVPNQFLK